MFFAEETRETVSGESARFGMAASVHVCLTAAGSVILDVKRNRYLGLGREQTELLADAVVGWPMPSWQRGSSGDRQARLDALTALCVPLVADGVLERIVHPNDARIARTLPDMRGEWISIGDELEVRGRVTLRHVLHFLAAFCWARYSLSLRPFSVVVEQVRAMKMQGGAGLQGCEIGRLAAMVDVFRQLRPFLFSAEGRCLLHALSLVRFLSHYELHPDWVIGVTTQPWGAHSWVQWQRYLLDSTPEKVCAYTPIMMV